MKFRFSDALKIVLIGALLLAALSAQVAMAATTILPPGETCFTANNGPAANGSMNFFIPNTTTPKATFKDSGQAAMNTQPVQLDMNGCAIVYGVGQYRQQLFDGPVVGGVTTGNLIFDQLTTDTSAFNSVFWAGTALASGTPNAIQITDTGFNGTDGSVVQFVALATNTGSTTINPSGFGNILVQKSTTAGPVSLIGGEIVQGNVISAVYSASSNTFQLLNAVIQSASGASAPLCGATGLKITNSTGTPSTIINLTANQVVMETAAGIVQSRGNVSLLNINISNGNSTSTANGMDGESPGTSQWLYIWMIDNGAAPAGLVSTSSTAPTLPNGYSYKCRLGAMQVDSSGNLTRITQLGNVAQYKVTTANTAQTFSLIDSTAKGSGCTSSTPTYATPTVSGNGFAVPPTATHIRVLAMNIVNGATVANVAVAPNSLYGGVNGSMGSMLFLPSAGGQTGTIDIVLEGSSIAWCSSAAGGAIYGIGWQDAVNAN